MEIFERAVPRREDKISGASEAATAAQGGAPEGLDCLMYLSSQEGSAMLAKEMAGIAAIDPGIKGIEDMYTQPWSEEFFGIMAENPELDMLQVYKIVSFEQNADRRAEDAVQAAIGKYAGKSHMTSVQSRGSGGVSVPEATLEMYRAIFPDRRDRDFEKHYSRHRG